VAASLEAAAAAYNELARARGYGQITDDLIPVLRHLPLREAIGRLGIPLLRAPFVWSAVRKAMRSALETIPPIAGMPETLRTLHGAGLHLAVVSSNSTTNIEAFLHANDLAIFARIEQAGLFAKHGVVRSTVRALGCTPTDVVYVGDEVRDVLCARKSGVRCAAVTWGLNSAEALRAASPDWMVGAPGELVDLFVSAP